MTSQHRFLITLAGLCSILISSNVFAGPFNQGSSRVSLALASGQFLREDYLIIGVGGGYYFADGFEIGLDADVWFGGDPSIYEITPTLQYVFQTPSISPYLGVFYSHSYISDYSDSESIGYRMGIYIPTGDRAYFGFGVVNSEFQDCTDTAINDCSDTYTELSLMLTL
ncbi:MAG: hypothetical protein ACN4GM_08525 [Gammaproteobacteria bacterium]